MKLLQGRIGGQEAACMLAIPVIVGCLFTMRSADAYAGANSTYLWVPLSVLLSLGGALWALRCMRRTQQDDLCGLYVCALGRWGGGMALLLLAALLFLQGFFVLSAFVGAMRSYIYIRSAYVPILLWIAAAAGYVAWGGLERVSRTAKCLGGFLALMLLLELLAPLRGYALYRLYPFSETMLTDVAGHALRQSAVALSPLLCALCFTGVQKGSRRSVLLAAALAAALLTMLAQLAISLAYTGEQLRGMFMPLYRLKMILIDEDYFLLQDKLGIFLWLVGAILSVGFALYGSGYLYCRALAMRDVRPPLLAGSALLCAMTYWKYEGLYSWFERMQAWVGVNGWWFVWVPALLACALAPLRAKKAERAL